MCEPVTMGIATAAVVAGTTLQVVGGVQRGQFEAQVARNQATQARWAAADALQRGKQAAGGVRAAGAAANATAIAGLAASGVETTTGSSAALIAANTVTAELDAEQAESNAVREVWGLESEAKDLEAQARFTKRSSFLGGVGTALSGAGQAAGTFAAGTR